MKRLIKITFSILTIMVFLSINGGRVFASSTADDSLQIQCIVDKEKGNIELYVTGTVRKVVFLVEKSEDRYYYYLKPGENAIVPITLGDGDYQLTVYLHIRDILYEGVWEKTVNIRLNDTLAPFLGSSMIVNWSPDSALARKAAELSTGKTQKETALAICDYLIENFTYYIPELPPNYLPRPDRVFALKRGICYDFSALYAAMCRSVGIPCKLHKGYSGYMGWDQYHAWCSVYVDDEWLAVDPTYSMTAGSVVLDDAYLSVSYTY